MACRNGNQLWMECLHGQSVVESPGHISVPLAGDITVCGDQDVADDTLAGSKGSSGLCSTSTDGFRIGDKQLSDQ